MSRPPLLVLAAVVAISPTAAGAQGWSAAGVAGAPRMQMRSDGIALATARVSAWMRKQDRSAERRIVLARAPQIASTSRSAPDVDVRPKDAWFDDQGFRVSPAGVAYRQRF